MEIWEDLCSICKHYHLGSKPQSCDAYPHRIPREIRLMYVDHRQPYKGDLGILFEPKDHSEETRKRLSKVKLRKPQRLGKNDLDHRVDAVLDLIPFRDVRHKLLFQRSIRKVETFEELSALSQQLILAGEARKQAETAQEDKGRGLGESGQLEQ